MSEFKDFVRTVYLSGPMDNLNTSNDPVLSMSLWREKAERYFADKGIQVVNPLRTPTATNQKFIVRGDKMSIKHSQAVLVNLTQVGKPGVNGKAVMGAGTIMEIIFAYSQGIPVVLFDTERSYEEISVWVKYHCVQICSTKLEAMQWITSLNDKRVRFNNFVEEIGDF